MNVDEDDGKMWEDRGIKQQNISRGEKVNQIKGVVTTEKLWSKWRGGYSCCFVIAGVRLLFSLYHAHTDDQQTDEGSCFPSWMGKRVSSHHCLCRIPVPDVTRPFVVSHHRHSASLFSIWFSPSWSLCWVASYFSFIGVSYVSHVLTP